MVFCGSFISEGVECFEKGERLVGAGTIAFGILIAFILIGLLRFARAWLIFQFGTFA